MTTKPLRLWELYDGLQNKFLYNNDLNSIYILLNLYDLEENISNIYPKYICLKNLKRRIKYALKNNPNKDKIAENISFIIHEDINRIELCFYLEGYKYGYNNNNVVNMLEKKAIYKYGVEGLYKRKTLFHYQYDDDIKEIRLKSRKEIDNMERKSRYIEGLVYTFSNKVVKKKIENIEKYVNKQLKMEIRPNDISIKEEKFELKDDEIDKVYHSIVRFLVKNLKNIYKDSCWMALNDKVLNRYL
ncbi:hypothetical protein [Dethiothermospora halolimnae]|uniref:hypothetical protein n=1 Tax=Dethiothermospora halolimnae TaxID=3114390 RepID=UPI003CCBF992